MELPLNMVRRLTSFTPYRITNLYIGILMHVFELQGAYVMTQQVYQ